MWRLFFTVCLAVLVAAPSMARAGAVNGFTFNLPEFGAAFTTPVSGLNGLTFDAGVRLLSNGPAGLEVAPGSQFFVQGFARITGYVDGVNPGNLNGDAPGLGTPYELTALFTNGGFYTDLDLSTGLSTSNHFTGAGTLDFYFDDLSDSTGAQADLATGTGFGDGELFASSTSTDFGAGFSNIFTQLGEDSTEYRYDSLRDNVFLTSSGADFSPDSDFSFWILSQFEPSAELPGIVDPVWDNLVGPAPAGFNPIGIALETGTILQREFDPAITAPIPLPGAVWLALAGLGAVGALRRRQA